MKKFFLKISGPQQRWPGPSRGHPHTPSLLVVADFQAFLTQGSLLNKQLKLTTPY